VFGRRILHLGKISPGNTLAPGLFSLGRPYFRLGEAPIAWVKLDPRASFRFPSDFALARLPSLGELCKEQQSI